MTRLVWVLLVAATVSGCVQTSPGRPVAGPGTPPASTTASTTADATPTESTSRPTREPSPIGVVPTQPDVVPPNAVTCLQTPGAGIAATAQIADPAAPKIVLSLPDGWSATPAATGLALSGPAGMTGSVTIATTDLAPAAAFEEYADDLAGQAPISSISVLPADHCGYSGQRLVGILSGGAGGNLSYEDRIAHVWTNTTDYLVAIHAAAPQGTAGFDAATETLMADFTVTIP